MSIATNSTIDHGKQVATTLSDKTAELESVKSKLEEYKRLADTDPLTHIWNRRAFDKKITGIYNSNKGILFNALILADIDRFKDINDRYGHPVGDKIIQIIADIFQTSIREDMFVARTGGEEFALIIEGASEDATFEIAERIRAADRADAVHQQPDRHELRHRDGFHGHLHGFRGGRPGGPLHQGRPGALPLEGRRPQPRHPLSTMAGAQARTGCSTRRTDAAHGTAIFAAKSSIYRPSHLSFHMNFSGLYFLIERRRGHVCGQNRK